MNTRNMLLAAVAAVVLAAGCATTEKPAPQPAPAPVVTPAPAPAEAKPAPAPAPVAKPQPAPAPKPAPAKPITLNATELFEFDKATLTPQARKLLDAEIVARAKDLASIRHVQVDGHADRLGSHPYNQRLSERRAEAVRAYLVSKGFDPREIETIGFGKTNPVKSCPGNMARKALIECLSPNRRVVVQVIGMPR